MDTYLHGNGADGMLSKGILDQSFVIQIRLTSLNVAIFCRPLWPPELLILGLWNHGNMELHLPQFSYSALKY